MDIAKEIFAVIDKITDAVDRAKLMKHLNESYAELDRITSMNNTLIKNNNKLMAIIKNLRGKVK